MSGVEVFNVNGCDFPNCNGVYKITAPNRYKHESTGFQLEYDAGGFWKIGIGSVCFYRSVADAKIPENCSWVDPISKRPQNIVVTSVATESSTSSKYASGPAISTSSKVSSSTPRASSSASVFDPPGESTKPSRPGQAGTVPYAGASRDQYRTTATADQRPSTTREPSSRGLTDDRQTSTRFERTDSRGTYLSRPETDRPNVWPSGGSEKAARKPAVTTQPAAANPWPPSATEPPADMSGLGSVAAQAGRAPLASSASTVGEISAKYQKYVDSGSLSPEKAALWTREDREKVEKRELARRLAAEPVTTQPKPPTANPYPTSVQSSMPRSASTDPYDRVNIPTRAPLASASVDIADTSSRSQLYTSDTAALLRKLSSQNLGTQLPLPRPDSAASVLSEIDKILHGEGKTSPAGGNYTSTATRTSIAPSTGPATADAAAGNLGFEIKARMATPAAVRAATPPSPPSTAPPAGLPRRHTGERTASISSVGARERFDTGASEPMSAKEVALPRTESRDSLKSEERSISRSLSRSGSAVDLPSTRDDQSGPTATSSYDRSSYSRPSALGDRSPPRSSLYPSRPSAADLAEDLARSNSGSFKRSDSSASLSRTASEAKLSPAAADRASARAAADEEHAAFMARLDAKKKEREEQRLQWEAKMAGRSPTAVSARSSALTPPPPPVASTMPEKVASATSTSYAQDTSSSFVCNARVPRPAVAPAEPTAVYRDYQRAKDIACITAPPAGPLMRPAGPLPITAHMSGASGVPTAVVASKWLTVEGLQAKSEEYTSTRSLIMEDARLGANGEAQTKWAAFFETTLEDQEGGAKQEGGKSVGASNVGGGHKEPRVDPALWAAVHDNPVPAQPSVPSPSLVDARSRREPLVAPSPKPTEDPAPSRPARKERVIEIAADPVPAKPKKFYQLCRHRLDATAGGMEVIVPSTYPGALDSDDAGRLDAVSIPEESAWAESERHWSATLQALEDVLAAAMGKELPRALESQRSIAEERKTLTETVARISAAIESTSKAEAQANQRAVNMTARTGTGHVQRDTPTNAVPQGFPDGEGIILECRAMYSTFDQFAWDVVNSLEDYCKPGSNVSKLFVHSLMLPVFSGTQRYLENALRTKQERMLEIFGPNAEITKRSSDNVAWQFWLYAQQLQMPTEVSAMNDQAIRDLAAGMGPLPAQLQDILEEELRADRVSEGLDVVKLVRLLLRLHTVALLSDPPCYLHPAPGVRLPYQEGHCVEILSPGTKKYGRIKESDVVEVVLGGLYFQDPATGAKPVQPMLVRRLA